MKKNILGLFSCLIFISVFANDPAPVVDRSFEVVRANRAFSMPTSAEHSAVRPSTDSFGYSDKQRIKRIEQQITNINEQNLTNKIEEMQETIRKLNGKVEVQEYQIEQLNIQVKDFYQDLDQRLEKNVTRSERVTDNATEVMAGGVVAATISGAVKKYKKPVPAKKSDKKALLKAQQMYQAAIDLLPERKDESKGKLHAYLKKYPKGAYVSDAHYWLGEINFLQRNFKVAEKEFKIVIDKYPSSRRVAGAMLKLALVHQNQGKKEQAKKELNQVIKKYSDTSAAQLARQQLRVMN